MKKVLILGCTGSIGKSTIDIIRNEKDSFSMKMQKNFNPFLMNSTVNQL